jgi:hypothetical protein
MRMLTDVAQGRESYMIVERLTDPTGQTYAQTQRLPDGTFVVEHREGSPETHVGTTVGSVREVHRLLAGWAFGVPGWDADEEWSPVDLD